MMHETYLAVFLSEELRLTNTSVRTEPPQRSCRRAAAWRALIGNLQGLTQFLAKASGGVSGTAADLASPGALVVAGFALSFASKPMFAGAGAVAAAFGTTACLYWITFAKVFDRSSKGVREAPSKALIGQLAAESGDSPAAAFSLRQSAQMMGGLAGSLAAAQAFRLSGGRYPLTFALSVVPAAVALLLAVAAVRRRSTADRKRAQAAASAGNGAGPDAASGLALLPKARALLGALGPAYWQALAVVSLLYLARFDLAFGTIRAATASGGALSLAPGFCGCPAVATPAGRVMDRATLPILLPIVALPAAVLATPAGLMAKRSARARNAVVVAGTAVLIGGNLCFAWMPTVAGMVLGAACIGVHMAATHGVSVGMLASYIPSAPVPGLGRISGTAWSFTDLLLGLVLAGSNALAGRLADATASRGMGNIGCFLGGATACALSATALLLFSAFGELGRDDLLTGAAGAAPEAAAGAAAAAEAVAEAAAAA
eukprot:scaffold7.g3453.t1